MTLGQKILRRYLPPLILALVTLSVFALVQNSGPRSVMRRFHEAIREKDDNTLYSLMVAKTPRESQAVESLRNIVLRLNATKFETYSYASAETEQYVLVATTYVNRQLRLYEVREYVLVWQNGRCKIDPDLSLSQHMQLVN